MKVLIKVPLVFIALITGIPSLEFIPFMSLVPCPLKLLTLEFTTDHPHLVLIPVKFLPIVMIHFLRLW